MIHFTKLPRVTLFCLALLLPGAVVADQVKETAALTTAMKLVDQRDFEGAKAAAFAAGPIGADLVEWSRLRYGDGLLGDYETFMAKRPDWPGMPLLKQKGEVAVSRSTDPARIIAYFGTDLPQTGTGALALVKAYDATGRAKDAEAEALRAWISLKFSAPEEAQLLTLHGPALKVAHEVRLDRLLWDGDRKDEAQRMLPRVSKAWAALATARLALRADQDGVTALVAAVPTGLKDDAGLAYERFLYRMRANNYADAATLIIERSNKAARLGDPEAWAERRILLARYLMRTGSPREAYKVATNHFLKSGTDYADLEFLSGYIALRKLNDPTTGLKHFVRLEAVSNTPISRSRAFYWAGRAYAAASDKAKAQDAYKQAAQYQTSYYGLLAAEKLGMNLDPTLVAGNRAAGDWRKSSFAHSSVLDAALRLARVDEAQLSARFFLHLGENLSDAELAQLADLALQSGQYRTAVVVAKAAADHGLVLPRPYFPMPDMVPDNLEVSRALALAISRRESEFDPEAQSPAGALGLMQLMPGTAEKVSKDMGLAYSRSRLTTDPAYNVQLGSAYLRQMVDEFGPSVALIASGYNAGPRRPREWIVAYGDPRLASVDVVDWVESIPFAETRTYVMRVAESVVIYRAKLKGAAGPVKITAELTGR
ncbi:MAG: lytic transglycosylase domain-containing protein [Paracoccaceae bacterium]